MSAKSKLSSFLSKDYAPGLFIIRIILYLVSTGLAIFDTYTDWELVLQFEKDGFNHPLLPLDLNWLRAWYFFAILGTIFTAVSISNETIDIIYSLWLFCQKYCCKPSCRCHQKTNEEVKANIHDVAFEMKESSANSVTETDNDSPKSENEAVIITDACRCCYRCGWNFTTRAETIAKFSLWFQDVPMLTLAILYAYSQSTCKLPEVRDVSGDLFNVGLSALASTAAVTFRLVRSILRLCASVGLRMKSKKEVSKMGKYGKFFSKILPEKGDAMYPPDTCAQCCIIPYYITLTFDFVLVFMGGFISLAIWLNYLSLKRTPNFDDSLAIFRFRYTGDSVHLLNISNNIIPASNGSFISFETVVDSGGKEVTHCLSEFQYREEDFDIFFNTIEVQAISDKGEFCAIKTGNNVSNFSDYSRCTLYYTYGGFVLFYGSTDRLTGEITHFDDECIVIKDRSPVVYAGPDLDFSIQVEKNIERTRHPNTSQDLLILYVSPQNSTTVVIFNVSVADIITEGLDVTYFHTFRHPSNGTNVTYLVRYFYNYFTAQFTYNVREVFNYPPPRNGRCSCSSQVVGLRQFLEIGLFVYGYFDPQIGRYPLLQNCSGIPFDKLILRYNVFLTVDCLSLCA